VSGRGGDRRLRNRSRGAVFLCYHSVAPQGPRYLTVSRELFERQLDELGRRGLRTGGLRELEDLAAGRELAPTAFLSFDDGFLDNYETAMPLLRERGERAFVFVLPPLVDEGAPLAWPEVAEDAGRHPETMRSVSWAMLEEMKEAGFEVGSHGLTHAHLPRLAAEELREELLDSRRRIAERLGACETLAYPFGEWSAEVAAAAGECGYRFAFSLPVKSGQRQASPLSIPRINVDYRDEGARLAAKLSPTGRRLYLSTALGSVRTRVRSLAGRD
jgi:peptidoglycan/xylan/chitin deacetylase (PgdA/CDA1 family)